MLLHMDIDTDISYATLIYLLMGSVVTDSKSSGASAQ